MRECVLAGVPLLAAMFGLVSCGYVGDVLPPALNIPQRVTDLAASEEGPNIRVSFTIPAQTTENLALPPVTPELRIGPAADPFQTTTWAQSATLIQAGQRQPGRVTVETPAAPFVGRNVAVAVRLANPKGRSSDWSNVVTVDVLRPLSAPTDVSAAATAKGVQVNWRVAGPGETSVSYRVFRQAATEDEPALLATVPQAPYIDQTAKYGTAYRYTVQAVQDKSESPVSRVASVTPVDTFPPDPPKGLTAVAGINTIELNWERSPEPDFASYRVYRSVNGGARERIASDLPTPVYTDRKVESGKRYQYAVTAVDQRNNESDPSSPAEATGP